MEHSIETHIGVDDLPVTVWFDYEPEQHQTYWAPGFPSEVDINAVCVDGNRGKDIQEVLDESTLENLMMQCHEYMESEQESDE